MRSDAQRNARADAGATLVELIVSIVVISVGLAGVLAVITRNTSSSADPVVQHQAVAIAEAYLEEIATKSFCDPDNAAATCTPGPGNVPDGPNCLVCDPGSPKEGARNLYDNVCDYHGLTESPPLSLNQGGAPINTLNGYTAAVQVVKDANLNGLDGNECRVLQVNVTVTGPGGVNYTLTGFRTNY